MNKAQKIAIIQNGLTVKGLGQILDRHPVYLSNVLSGRVKSPTLRKKICKVLEREEKELWPQD